MKLIITLILSASALIATEKPNIVLFLADDVGWNDVGFHNNGEFQTPAIDSLVKDGVEFSRFYTTSICSPTRAGVMTGKYPIRHGGQRITYKPWDGRWLPESDVTIPQALKSAGYNKAGCFGKWHLGHEKKELHPLSRGFTDFVGHFSGAIGYFSKKSRGSHDWHRNWKPEYNNEYATDLIGKEAADFVRRNKDEQWFLYVPFNGIHTPNDTPKDKVTPAFSNIKSKLRRQKAKMMWSMDRAVARVLKALDETGQQKNTLVIFLSDNGGAGAGSSNAPLKGRKHYVYEGGIRVVAAARWPGKLTPGGKVNEPISYLDLMPTFMHLAGVKNTLDLDGENAWSWISGEKTNRQFVFHSYFQGKYIKGQQKRAVKHERNAIHLNNLKLVREGPNMLKVSDYKKDATIELFDVVKDPEEKHNLADQQPELVDTMLKKMLTFRCLQPKEIKDVSPNAPKGWKPPKTLTWEQ